MKLQANYIGMIVDDLDTATAFYRDQLGWPVNTTESLPGAFIQFDLAGGTIVALQAQSEVTNGQRFETAMYVEDVDATFTAWQATGVEMLDTPHDKPFGRTFLMQTPAGHVWRVYGPHKAA